MGRCWMKRVRFFFPLFCLSSLSVRSAFNLEYTADINFYRIPTTMRCREARLNIYEFRLGTLVIEPFSWKGINVLQCIGRNP